MAGVGRATGGCSDAAGMPYNRQGLLRGGTCVAGNRTVSRQPGIYRTKRMGIKFACAECGHVLHVKSSLAGKRGFCPKCQAKVEIPAEGPPTAAQSAGVAAYDTPESVNMAVESPAAVVAAVAPLSPVEPRAPMAVPVAVAREQAADPIAENPEMQWYVVPPGACSAPTARRPANCFAPGSTKVASRPIRLSGVRIGRTGSRPVPCCRNSAHR